MDRRVLVWQAPGNMTRGNPEAVIFGFSQLVFTKELAPAFPSPIAIDKRAPIMPHSQVVSVERALLAAACHLPLNPSATVPSASIAANRNRELWINKKSKLLNVLGHHRQFGWDLLSLLFEHAWLRTEIFGKINWFGVRNQTNGPICVGQLYPIAE